MTSPSPTNSGTNMTTLNDNNNPIIRPTDVVIALQDFQPYPNSSKQDGESNSGSNFLYFTQGQVLYVLNKHDSNKNVWWEGFTIQQQNQQNQQNQHQQQPHSSSTNIIFDDLDNYNVAKRGWFPASFVKSVYSLGSSNKKHQHRGKSMNSNINLTTITNTNNKAKNIHDAVSSRKNSLYSSISSDNSEPLLITAANNNNNKGTSQSMEKNKDTLSISDHVKNNDRINSNIDPFDNTSGLANETTKTQSSNTENETATTTNTSTTTTNNNNKKNEAKKKIQILTEEEIELLYRNYINSSEHEGIELSKPLVWITVPYESNTPDAAILERHNELNQWAKSKSRSKNRIDYLPSDKYEKFLKILYYNKELDCYCNKIPFIQYPEINPNSVFEDEEIGYNSIQSDLKTRDLDALNSSTVNEHVPSISSSINSATAAGISSAQNKNFSGGKNKNKNTEEQQTDTSDNENFNMLSKTPLLYDEVLFYMDEASNISSWSSLLNHINVHVDKAHHAVFGSQPSASDFQYNLNLVSKYSIYMNNAVRLLQYKLDDHSKKNGLRKQQKKDIKRSFKLLRKSFFIISINTYLYFNSKKFHYKNAHSRNFQRFKQSIMMNEEGIFSTTGGSEDEENHDNEDPFGNSSSDSDLDETSRRNNVPKYSSRNANNTTGPGMMGNANFNIDEKENENDDMDSSYVIADTKKDSVHTITSDEPATRKKNSGISFQRSSGSSDRKSSGYSPLDTSTNKGNRFLFRSNSTTTSHPGLHMDLLVQSISDEFAKYKSATLQLYKLMVIISIPHESDISDSPSKTKNLDLLIPQLTPHFFKKNFSGGSWIDFTTDVAEPENDTNGSSDSLSKNVTSSLSTSLPLLSYSEFFNKHKKQHKTQLSRELVANFIKVTDTLKEKAPECFDLLDQPHTMKRSIQLTLHTNMVLSTTVTLMSQLESIDLSFYSSFQNLKFTLKEDGSEFTDIKKWQQQSLEAISGILMEFAEVKQAFHNHIISGVMDAQSICLTDPYVFCAMRGELSYEFSTKGSRVEPINQPTKNAKKNSTIPSAIQNHNSFSQATINNQSISSGATIPFSPSTVLANNSNGTGSMSNTVGTELKNLLISKDVETNSQEYWDCDSRLRQTVERFCENYSVTCDILEQLVELKENFVNTAFRFMNNPKIAALLKDELQHRGSSSLNSSVSNVKISEKSSTSINSLSDLRSTQNSISGSNFSHTDLKSVSLRGSQKFGGELEAWYLRDSYDYFLLYNEKGQVKAGTKEALIEHLTSHKYTDPFFNIVMLTTFRSMFSTNEFLRSILHRYTTPPPDGLSYDQYASWVKLKLTPIKQNCFNILYSMLKDYWHDAYVEPGIKELRIIGEFFQDDNMKDHQEFAKLFEERTSVLLSEKQTQSSGKLEIHTEYLSFDPEHYKRTGISILEISPIEFADQLTLKEHDLYCKITKFECIDRIWNNKYCNFGGSPHIKRFINTSNLITNYITYQIVRAPSLDKRVKFIQYFINVADRCFYLNNFSSMTAVISGLSSSPVYRLKKTWSLVDQDYRDKLTKLNAVMDSSRNFAKYREVLNQVKDENPCIPFLGVSLSDLTFTYGGNPDVLVNYQEVMINFSKRAKLTEIILRIMKLQQKCYKIKVYPPVMDFIEFYCCVDTVPSKHSQEGRKSDNFIPDIDYLYEQSLIIEPRAAKKTQKINAARFGDIFNDIDHPGHSSSKAVKASDLFTLKNKSKRRKSHNHSDPPTDSQLAAASASSQSPFKSAKTQSQAKKVATKRLLFGNKSSKS